MQSMTGYGKAEYISDSINLIVEIKSVNNRFLDVVPKYPKVLNCFDDIIRKTVASKISRGRVELFITLNDSRELDKNIDVDLTIAKAYHSAYLRLIENFPKLKDEFSVYSLMRMPDVLKDGGVKVEPEFYSQILIETLSGAIDNLNVMRRIEGDKLKTDLLSRISTIENLVNSIRERAPQIKESYNAKIKERIQETMGEVDFDQARLLQEVAIFADKTNIDEEITRLKSHISHFREMCDEESAGRKLDFLVQELNREANTVCSKSNDLTLTRLGLEIKGEIEKIREQIQNIE